MSGRPARGRLVLVTGINPTAAGEGKTTTSVGLTQALRRLGRNATLCIREPSLGPVFGVKGGAAGGGYAQVVPMEDINLHFTGDFHAISSAHSLLSAMLDNHLHQGNSLKIDTRRITWPRTIDMNDRALRDCVIGLGGVANGVAREERWVIIPASEVMAIVALSSDVADLEARLSRIIVGRRVGRGAQADPSGRSQGRRRDGPPAQGCHPARIWCRRSRAAQRSCTPGRSATSRTAATASWPPRRRSPFPTSSSPRPASDRTSGAEKFFDIKCRFGGLKPEAAVLVATVRALKLNGGANKNSLKQEDLGALERGLPNLEKHIENVRQFGVPVVVAVNRFVTDTDAELRSVADRARAAGAHVALAEVWEKGGAGGEELARAVLGMLDSGHAKYAPLYPLSLPIRQKIDTIVKKVYGGDGVDFTPKAERTIDYLESIGLDETPVCMAKTQYSLTDDPTVFGRPSGFRITINDLYPAAGAGFVVAQAGDIMTMPGLPKEPAAERMAVHPDGSIVGLF